MLPRACSPVLAAKAYLEGIRAAAAAEDDDDNGPVGDATGLNDDELGERLKEEALEVTPRLLPTPLPPRGEGAAAVADATAAAAFVRRPRVGCSA